MAEGCNSGVECIQLSSLQKIRSCSRAQYCMFRQRKRNSLTSAIPGTLKAKRRVLVQP